MLSGNVRTSHVVYLLKRIQCEWWHFESFVIADWKLSFILYCSTLSSKWWLSGNTRNTKQKHQKKKVLHLREMEKEGETEEEAVVDDNIRPV